MTETDCFCCGHTVWWPRLDGRYSLPSRVVLPEVQRLVLAVPAWRGCDVGQGDHYLFYCQACCPDQHHHHQGCCLEHQARLHLHRTRHYLSRRTRTRTRSTGLGLPRRSQPRRPRVRM